MNENKRFQKNVALWSRTCPKQALILPYIDSSSLTTSFTKWDEPNLERIDNGMAYHATTGAIDEAKKWFTTLNLDDTDLLCIYGIGLGYYFDEVIEWLKKHKKHRIIFLEDDLCVIQKLFETERGSKILKHSQVQLFYFANLKDKNSIFSMLHWEIALKHLTITALESYAKQKKEVFEDLTHELIYKAALTNQMIDEYMRYGASFYLNFYQNILHLPDSYLGDRLFNKFQGVPAIICGAGPSLTKHLSYLKQLSDKAIIFAGGSSLNALSSAGISPHFGAGIDPNPTQLERLQSSNSQTIPFFYRNRMFHEAFKMIRGPRLYITGSGGYETAEYFEEYFKINSSDIDEGHNVINFCVEIAGAMGCNPIIFIGVDLAFTGKQTYAPGIIENTEMTLEELSDEDKPFIRTDIYGQPTYTVWKWIAESKWISTYAKEHPFTKLINCTEGGIGFSGVPNQSFVATIHSELKNSFDLKNRIDEEIQKSKILKVTQKKVILAMNELKKSLKNTIKQLDILTREARQMIVRLKQDKTKTQLSGLSILAETELSEEIGFKYVLSMFNEMYTCLLSTKAREIRLKHQSEGQRMLRKLPLNIKKYRFLRNVARMNIKLIDYPRTHLG